MCMHAWGACVSSFEERTAWSAPRVTMSGRITSRAKLIWNERTTTGSKERTFLYMSSGERVPEVITTDWKRSKTGLMAIEASLQHSWTSGKGR